MNESDFIQRFKELKTKILENKSRMNYATDKTPYLDKIRLLEKDLEYSTNLLKSCPDRSTTLRKTEKLKSVLTGLHKIFSKTDNPYNFSRDQGLIIHGFIYLKIIEDIIYAFDHDRISVSEYYLDTMSDFDCTELNKILSESIDLLNVHIFGDYIELYEYVKSLQKKITSLDSDCGLMTI